MTLKPSNTQLAIVALVSLLLDQASKWGILLLLPSADPMPIAILPFMDFVLVWNSGISYGFLADHSQVARFGLITLSLLIVGFLLSLLRRELHPWLRFGYALIIGGALGNVIDRVIHGAVVDFISLHGFGYYWYVFNLADIWITMGGGLIVWLSVKPSKTELG
jgi:signal peptidase II